MYHRFILGRRGSLGLLTMGYDRDEYRTKQPQDLIFLFYAELRKELKDCAALDVGCERGWSPSASPLT